jgi:cysteinyl-tRNA synthetase
LGETFDIHGGGSDLKFPHHENEIAQSECVTGKEFAKIWMHTGSLRIDKEKMSKSLKNFITIKDALKANSAEVLRFFLISSHYRSPLNYSEELLKEAKSSLDRIYNSLDGLNLDSESANRSGYSKTFTDAMDDDFNTPAAIAILFEMTREINNLKKDEEIEKANNLGSELKMLSQSLGILQKNPSDYFKSGVDLTDKEIENLIDQRSTARQNRDFALSDSIRDSLLEKGIILEDKETGTVWKKN